jgi:hypothetical protein
VNTQPLADLDPADPQYASRVVDRGRDARPIDLSHCEFGGGAMTRKGSMLVEVSAAMMMLAVLTTVCLEFFSAVSEQRRQLFTQLTATQEAANLLERTEAWGWEELSSEAAAKLQLSDQARKTLPEGRFEMLVEGPSGDPPAKRVLVSVCWRPLPGGPERKVKLATWRHKNR